MPGLDLVSDHPLKCGSELRILGGQLGRMKWELTNRLVGAFFSADSAKKSYIVTQLLAHPRRLPYFRQSSIKFHRNVAAFIALTLISHTQGDCIGN